MKTVQELYNEITSNDDLKKAFAAAAQSEEAIVAFAKEHGVDTTLEEIKAFLKEQTQAGNKELAPEEMENAAGGACNKFTTGEVLASTLSFGFGCAIAAFASAVKKNSHVGQEDPDEGRLCSKNKEEN